jgi:hypothetical protein
MPPGTPDAVMVQTGTEKKKKKSWVCSLFSGVGYSRKYGTIQVFHENLIIFKY